LKKITEKKGERNMTWNWYNDIKKQQGYTVRTTPPLAGYTPEVFGERKTGNQRGEVITSSGVAEAFYHLKEFVIEKKLTIQATEFGTGPTADIPMKGTIGQMAQQRGEPDTKVADFEIVSA
jgi:hypothetical protein